MPVQYQSLEGLVPPKVEQLLKNLTLATNALEGAVGAADREAALAARIAQLEQQVQNLTALLGVGDLARIVVAADGALGGNGTAASPLRVRVDGSTVQISANQLTAP